MKVSLQPMRREEVSVLNEPFTLEQLVLTQKGMNHSSNGSTKIVGREEQISAVRQ